MSTLIYYAIPFFIITMILEALWAAKAKRSGREIVGYELKDTFSSIGLGLSNVLIAAVAKLLLLPLWLWCYERRLFDIPVAWWSWLLLLFAEDLCYYWFHRIHHEVRFFWAAHENHHSSQHYNLSTALRQSLTTPFTGLPFWLPLLFLGFPPEMVLTQQAFSLLYQYWLHTEGIKTMGPLEWILNTPSHHRVHHGRNVEYLDKNHAGIFIIWDKLFGSFAPERERVDYGLTTNITTFNPIKAGLHEWVSIIRDVRGARSLSEVWGYVFGPPGWSPDGSRLTARQMQAQFRGAAE